MKAECTISKPYPRGFHCHKEGGYDPNHYQCKPCRFNSVAWYKKEREREQRERLRIRFAGRKVPQDSPDSDLIPENDGIE